MIKIEVLWEFYLFNMANLRILWSVFHLTPFTLGFDDSFRLLERLSLYEFRVPVDLAIQQFKVEFIR